MVETRNVVHRFGGLLFRRCAETTVLIDFWGKRQPTSPDQRCHRLPDGSRSLIALVDVHLANLRSDQLSSISSLITHYCFSFKACDHGDSATPARKARLPVSRSLGAHSQTSRAYALPRIFAVAVVTRDEVKLQMFPTITSADHIAFLGQRCMQQFNNRYA